MLIRVCVNEGDAVSDSEQTVEGWHFAVNSESTGPVSVEDIASRIQRRQLGPTTLVWRTGMGEWAPLVQMPELSRFLREPPTSPTGPIAHAGMAPIGESSGMRMLLPVGRSGWAIAAGYLGLFSVLLVPAPLALILGIGAVIHIRGSKHLHGMGRAVFAIIAGGLGSVGLLWMLIVLALGR